MKKVFFLASALIFASILTTSAKQITQKQSRLVAEEIATSSPFLRNNISDLKLIQTVYDKSTDLRSETILYYVYKITDDKGFVIVSGDDCFYPVIGYSLEDRYDMDNIPPNFRLWMEDVESSISKTIRENKQATERTAKAWDAYLNGNSYSLRSSQSVNPLIQTKWNQGPPYNNKCIFSETTTIAGCVATTMAQIMNYYKYPDTGFNAIPAYITKTNKYPVQGIPVSEMAYDWSILRNTYNSKATDSSADEIAKLILHCGISVEMDYTPKTSGAYTQAVATALSNYFGYDKGANYKYRQYYPDNEWNTILKRELNRKRPVVYAGQNSSSEGHAFICDGYDNNDLFHFNFGWGGSYDGFYFIDDIEYSYSNGAIIGIQKDKGGSQPFEVVVGPNQGQFVYPDILSSTRQVYQNIAFTVSASFWNIGSGIFKGDIGFVLLNSDFDFIENISSMPVTIEPSVTTGLKDFTCKISTNIEDGNYYIRPAVLPSGSSTWKIINAQNGHVGILPLRIGDPIYVASVDLDSMACTLSAGDKIQCTFIISPEDATNQNVIWSSSDETIATVSSTGLVKALSQGEAIITVTTEDGNKTADCKITVEGYSSNIQNSLSGIRVYLRNNDELYINTPFAETISIYTVIGSPIHSFDKPAGECIINTGRSSETLWIVKGSSNWIRKILLK